MKPTFHPLKTFYTSPLEMGYEEKQKDQGYDPVNLSRCEWNPVPDALDSFHS